jgi:hypothetical protein
MLEHCARVVEAVCSKENCPECGGQVELLTKREVAVPNLVEDATKPVPLLVCA